MCFVHTWHYTDYNFDFNWDNNTGISARVFVDFPGFSYFNTEGELGYSQKGARIDVFTTTKNYPAKIRKEYFRLMQNIAKFAWTEF